MPVGKLRRAGNTYVITVPRQEVTRLQLKEGDLVQASLVRVEPARATRPDLRAAMDRVLPGCHAALEYLRDR